MCPRCGGSGRVEFYAGEVEDCPYCRGDGSVEVDIEAAIRRELYQLEDENALTVKDRREVAARIARAVNQALQ